MHGEADMLRLNNSYCDFMRFTAGRESSMADKSVRQESNLMLACTSAANVSEPLGYNYQHAITMSRSNSMVIAALLRGTGTFTVSEQLVYEVTPNTTFTGNGTFVADLAVLEEMIASFFGEGSFTAASLIYEVISALFDAGSRPSARDIAWETWMLNLSLISDVNSAAYKLNNLGDPFTANIEGPLDARDAIRVLLAIAAGKTTIINNGGGLAQVKFRDTTDSVDRVVADMNNSERTNLTIS